LASAASTFRPTIGPNIKYQVEIRNIKIILDNVRHWQVFSDDLELQRFLHTMDEFSNISIDQESQEGEDEESKDQQAPHLLKTVAGHDIVDLKSNHILRGLVQLEILFDSNYVYKGVATRNQ
jgi:hypothetical protein